MCRYQPVTCEQPTMCMAWNLHDTHIHDTVYSDFSSQLSATQSCCLPYTILYLLPLHFCLHIDAYIISIKQSAAVHT